MNLRQLRQAIILACQRLHAQIIQNSLDGMVNRIPRCIYVQGQFFQMNKSSNACVNIFIVRCVDKNKIKVNVNYFDKPIYGNFKCFQICFFEMKL